MLWKMEVFNIKGERISLLTQIENVANPKEKVEAYFLWYFVNIVQDDMYVSIKRQKKNSHDWEEMTIVNDPIPDTACVLLY